MDWHPFRTKPFAGETVRWQSDGVTDSLYRNIVPSGSVGADTGLYQLSMDYLDADFSASAAVSNGSGRVAMGLRNNSGVDVNFRLFFNNEGGSSPQFRLQVSDDLGNNQTIATFPGATLDHLNVRAVYDFDNMGSAGSYQVYYRVDGGSEVAAYTAGQLPTGFALDKLRLVTQTYNGGVNWSTGDRVFTDNLVLRLLGEPLPVFFTVDPISRPAADVDVAYTGQSISGTASNAASYSIVAGPAWLSIAPNGDLSGTPAADDIGANSWIVQASNGAESDTAVLHITVDGAGGGAPGGNISFAYESDDKPDAAGTDDTTFADISVEAGDVVAVSVAPNKSYAVNPLALVWSGTEGADGNTTMVKPASDLDSRTSYVFYTRIINSGTYTFIVDGNGTGLTSRSKLFVLRANSDIIGVGDEATLSSNTSTPGISYDFSPATLPVSAIAIESFASKTGGTLTPDAAYTEDFDTATRHLMHSTNVTGATWSKTHSNSSGPAKFSGAGVVFYEQTSGADNAPPVFNSDPVVEVDATQDVAYNASLADNATDNDSDPMSFSIISGPAWLNAATNGVLTGTPLSGDIGLNSWKVAVSDGMATNFATLEIDVIDPAPPVASPDRTRLHPTNNYNVLFIAIDDMRPLINAYGETEPLLPNTPNMDRLAESGVMFANAHCQQAVCNASRASLLTGLRPDTTMCWKLDTFFRDQVPNVITLPQHFGNNGYRVHGIGKIYHSTNKTSQDDPLSWNEGWSSSSTTYTWYETDKAALEDAGTNKVSATDAGEVDRLGNPITDEAYNDGYAAAQGVTKIAEYAASYQSSDTPFFLAVGFQKPHMPFNCPKTYWDLYDPAEIDLTGYTGIRQMPVDANKFTAPYGGEPSAFLDITGTVDNGMPTAAEARHLIHGYLACVSYIDTQIGKLLDALEDPDGNPGTDDSIADNTIIVLWGDHGFHLGDHNGFWAKHSNYEISTRVPLIISTPGMQDLGAAGTRSVGLVELVDLYPTLVDLCSLPAPSQPAGQALQGTTFLPLLEDPAQPWKKAVFSQFQRNINDNEPGDVPVNNSGQGMGYTIRTERYRYTEWWVTESTDETDRHIIKAGITEPGHIELYDYVADPAEATNLASNASYNGLMAELSALLNDSNPVSAGDGWTLPESDAPAEYPLAAAVWKTNYLSPGRVISELDWNGDPDGDTIINRFEYKFGTHPFVAEASPVFYGLDAGGLYLTYPDVEARTNVLLEAATTTNLVSGSWTSSGVTETNEGQQGNATIKKGSVPVVDPTRFLRLEASDL
jgi:iduronate 2-sulfatase